MIVFIDTNLVLDVMLENSEFYDESNDVLSYCNKVISDILGYPPVTAALTWSASLF